MEMTRKKRAIILIAFITGILIILWKKSSSRHAIGSRTQVERYKEQMRQRNICAANQQAPGCDTSESPPLNHEQLKK
jgi:hypothetical protein